MTTEREVPEKKYPPEVKYSKVLKGIAGTSLVSSAFHHLMGILLITGLIIDLLGPWVGEWISSIRSIAQSYVGAYFNGYVGTLFVVIFIVYLAYRGLYAQRTKTAVAATLFVDFLFYIALVVTGLFAHGYVGSLYILVFIIYVLSIGVFKRVRMVFTVTNYVDFLFYFVLIITGMTMSSAVKPWVDLFPGLFDVLSPIAPYGPAIHVVATYVWIVFSTVFPGGILHGIASVYLISHLKKRSKAERSRTR